MTLFQRWKDAKGFASERQAMQALGLSHGAAVHWKAGREASAEIIERMARDLGEEPIKWAALAMIGQTKGETSRAWSRMARKLGAAAAVACVIVALPHLANEKHAFFAGISAFFMPLNIGPFIHYANLAGVAAALIALGFYCRDGRFRELREVAPAVLA